MKIDKKRSIYTLTPNPTLDLGGRVVSLVPNEKNYVQDETRCPGGNGINVARLLKRLSIPVCATGFLGGSVGSEVSDLLENEGVPHQFIKIKGDTRISVTVSNLKAHEQTRLSFTGPHIDRKEVQLLKQQISKIPEYSWLVIGGSFPPGFQTSHLNQMINSATKRNIYIVLDVPGSLLRKSNLKGITLIKPNLTEFQELIGKKVKSISAIIQAAKILAQEINFVCVSSVNGGALLVNRDSVWFGTLPKVKIRSTVGAGDSMVAGMVAELWSGQSGANLLRHGLASAAATLTTRGTQLGNPRDIRKFYRKIKITNFS